MFLTLILTPKFEKINKVSFADFLNVGFVASAAAQNNLGFTRGYFNKARSQGIRLPGDIDILAILDQLAADPKKFMELYRRYKAEDRRFAMYDSNPLFVYPIIRPWRQKKAVSVGQDRMVAPLPNGKESRQNQIRT